MCSWNTIYDYRSLVELNIDFVSFLRWRRREERRREEGGGKEGRSTSWTRFIIAPFCCFLMVHIFCVLNWLQNRLRFKFLRIIIIRSGPYLFNTFLFLLTNIIPNTFVNTFLLWEIFILYRISIQYVHSFISGWMVEIYLGQIIRLWWVKHWSLL